jgi:hypothetical protein
VGFIPTAGKHSADIERRGGIDYSHQTFLEISVVPVPANPGATLSRSDKERREDKLAEIMAVQREHEAKANMAMHSKPKLVPVSLPPEVVAAQAKLAQARARRAELKLVAGMTVDEHREYIDAKAAKKRERQRQLDEMRGRQ